MPFDILQYRCFDGHSVTSSSSSLLRFLRSAPQGISRFPLPDNPASRHPDTPTSRHPDTPTPRHPDIPTSRHPDIPTPRHPDTPTSRQPDIPTPRHPDTPTSRHPDNTHTHARTHTQRGFISSVVRRIQDEVSYAHAVDRHWPHRRSLYLPCSSSH